MTISNFALLGIVEAFAAVLVMLVVFIFLYQKANGRIMRLRTQQRQLKESTVFLLEKVNETKPESYADQLSEQAQENIGHFNKMSPGEPLTWQDSLDPTSKVAVLRNYFLQGEIKAHEISDTSDKWTQLTKSLEPVLDCLSPGTGTGASEDHVNENLKEKWVELCDAAIVLRAEQSTEAEDNFVVLLQLINSELGLEQLIVPDRKVISSQPDNENRGKVNNLMASAEDQKELISNLLSQKDAAESEVSVKVEELKRLQQFLKESEVCITLLEDESTELRTEIAGLKNSVSRTQVLQHKIEDFEQECSKMITCIESLERENDDLRARAG